MKRNTITKVILAFFIHLFAFSTTFAQQADFSGNWQINMQKSEFGDIPTYTASKAIKVKYLAGQMILERTSVDDSGRDSISVQKINLNGEPALIRVANHTIKKITLNFIAGGQSLREHTVITNNDGETMLTLTTDWTLAADKKSLIMILNAESANGSSYTIKAIYDKE